MLITKLRDDFIEKHSWNCNAEQLLHNYNHYFDKYGIKGDEHDSVDCFADCLGYIKKLLIRYEPKKVVKLISALGQMQYDETNVEREFIFLMHRVTVINLFIKDYKGVAFWAKKTVDLMDYFHPTSACLNREYLFEKNRLYQDCHELYQTYKEYLDEEIYKGFIFYWEHDFYSPNEHSNDNSKKRFIR